MSLKKTHTNAATFNFRDTEVRTIQKCGVYYFVLSDICKVLEIANARNAARRLDEDEKDVHLVDTLGGKQEMTVVNESGLYAVILRSDKPQAKAFRKWITSEVLPTLRKTGSYTVKPTDDTKMRMLATREENAKIRKAQLLYKVSKDCGVPKYQQVLQSHITRLLTGQQLLPLPAAKLTFSAEEIGNRLGLTACMVGRLTNAYNLKNERFGEWIYDKAKTADKQVRTFRYYENVINELRRVAEC